MKQIYFGGYYFELIKSEKRCANIIDSYNKSDMYSIWDAYKAPSHAKLTIYRRWLEFKAENMCKNFKVISKNCQYFTLGFQFNYQGGTWLSYITPTHNYAFPI